MIFYISYRTSSKKKKKIVKIVKQSYVFGMKTQKTDHSGPLSAVPCLCVLQKKNTEVQKKVSRKKDDLHDDDDDDHNNNNDLKDNNSSNPKFTFWVHS